MPLVRGIRLGPFEIIAAVGSGGMGDVYRARDTNLNRDVAIKVLPELFARDPDRLTRFRREAQTLAALNHPNVAQVYAVEELPMLPPEGGNYRAGEGGAGQTAALVMEFVDGEDLAQRIARGAIPIDDAIEVGRQIACGLEAAHERGIVHRDLKPANVRITPHGVVKVLDFGLAKAADDLAQAGGSDVAVANSPTFTSPLTQMGMILGTAAYMAPEQARGKPVDKRADIWAFGCVVYEMLTAKRPFTGETVTDTLAAIVKVEADWTALPVATPSALRRLLAHCLVKDPKQRLRDIGDARIALERMIVGGADDAPATSAPARQSGRRFGFVPLVAAAAGLAIVASGVTWRLTRAAREPPRPPARFVLPLSYEVLPLRSNGTGVAFSPDGTSVVYAGQPVLFSASVLYRRRLNALDVEKIPSAEGAYAPFFSPDSRWIGFFTDRAVMKLSVDGGSVSKICDRGPYSRADWGPNDTIVLGTSQAYSPGSLGKVSAAGGTPVPLTRLEGTETIHQLPHVLPDGRHVIFTAVSPTRSELAIVPIDGGAHRLLDVEGSGVMFVPPDRVLFARADLLFAAPFDLRTLRVTGPPVQVLDDASVFAGGVRLWIPQIGVDRAGSIAYLTKGGATSVLGWLGVGASFTELAFPEGAYGAPRLSPDGRRAALSVGLAPPDIWVFDLERGTRLRLTSTGGNNPVWSTDGSRIAYASADTGIMTIAADGSGKPEVVLPRQDQMSLLPTSWSSDGSVVVTAEDRGAGRGARNRDIWIVRAGEKPIPLLASPADERGGAVSPNGQWLAYASSVSGREEVYVRAFRGGGATIPVSTGGGTLPKWSAAGDAVYFLAVGPRLMRAAVSGTPPQIAVPVVTGPLPATFGGVDVAPDGRVLVVQQKSSTASVDALHVILNWGHSLK